MVTPRMQMELAITGLPALVPEAVADPVGH